MIDFSKTSNAAGGGACGRPTPASSPRSGRSRPASPASSRRRRSSSTACSTSTGPQNHAWAIDGKTGEQIWRYQRPVPARTSRPAAASSIAASRCYGDRAVHGDARRAPRRARHEDRQGDLGHRDRRLPARATRAPAAPLIVKDKVIVGIAGGEFAIRGFLDAYDVDHRASAPGASRPCRRRASRAARRGRRTSLGTRRRRRRGCPASYDPELNTLYWGTGQSQSGFLRRRPQGRQPVLRIAHRARCRHRQAEVALPVHAARRARLGREPDSRCLRTSPSAASRARWSWWPTATASSTCSIASAASSFSAKPFVHQTWAKEIGADGRPIELPDQRPTREGHADLPGPLRRHQLHVAVVRPGHRPVLRVARARPARSTSRKRRRRLQGGRSDDGRTRRARARHRATGALRAIDPLTGERKWEIKHPTPSWAGVLSTAGGVVFSGDEEGFFIAADSRTGKELWRYQLGRRSTPRRRPTRSTAASTSSCRRDDADGVRAAGRGALSSRTRGPSSQSRARSALLLSRTSVRVDQVRVERASLPTSGDRPSAEKSRSAGAACSAARFRSCRRSR